MLLALSTILERVILILDQKQIKKEGVREISEVKKSDLTQLQSLWLRRRQMAKTLTVLFKSFSAAAARSHLRTAIKIYIYTLFN